MMVVDDIPKRGAAAAPASSQQTFAGDLGWLFEALTARSGMIARIVALGTLLAVAFVLVTPPLYKASVRILIEKRSTQVISSEQTAPDSQNFDFAAQSQAEVLGSPHSAERVIRALKLFGYKPPVPKAGTGEVAAEPATPPSPFAADDAKTAPPVPAAMIEKFMSRLSVYRIEPTSVIQVDYLDPDPKLAAKVADKIAEFYLEDQVRAKSAMTHQANNWLRSRIAQLKDQVRAAEDRVQQFKAEHNMFDVGEQTLNERMLSVTSDQLVTARTAANESEAKVQQFERALADKTQLSVQGKSIQSELIKDFRRQYAEMARKKANLVTRFGINHPDVANADAELRDIDNQIAREIDRLVEAARSEYESAKAQVALLEQRVEQIKSQMSQGNKVAADLAELKREASATSGLYASLLTRFHETEAREGLHTPDARIIGPATVPAYSSYPRKRVAIPLAFGLSLLLAIIAALFKETMEGVLRKPGDIERSLGVRCIATLPMVAGPGSEIVPAQKGLLALLIDTVRHDFAQAMEYVRRARTRYFPNRAPQVPSAADEQAPEVAPILRPLHDATASDTEFAEALFLVKGAIGHVNHKGKACVFAVVSARAGEGKTVVAMGLADYVSSCGGRTLLIDADLRKSDLTRALCPEAGLSLADVARGATGADKAVVSLDGSNLDFCPAPLELGGQRPMDLLSSPHLAQFLDRKRPEYEFIIIDTTALSDAVDVIALMRCVDTAVVVVEHAKTGREAVRALLKEMGSTATDGVGVVLNKAPPRLSRTPASGNGEAGQDPSAASEVAEAVEDQPQSVSEDRAHAS